MTGKSEPTSARLFAGATRVVFCGSAANPGALASSRPEARALLVRRKPRRETASVLEGIGLVFGRVRSDRQAERVHGFARKRCAGGLENCANTARKTWVC